MEESKLLYIVLAFVLGSGGIWLLNRLTGGVMTNTSQTEQIKTLFNVLTEIKTDLKSMDKDFKESVRMASRYEELVATLEQKVEKLEARIEAMSLHTEILKSIAESNRMIAESYAQ